MSAADHIELTQFVIGLLTGLVIMAALVQVRIFAQAMLCAAALGLGYLLYRDGVPGLIEHTSATIDHLQHYRAFVQGVFLGKFVAGFLKWRSGRRAS